MKRANGLPTLDQYVDKWHGHLRDRFGRPKEEYIEPFPDYDLLIYGITCISKAQRTYVFKNMICFQPMETWNQKELKWEKEDLSWRGPEFVGRYESYVSRAFSWYQGFFKAHKANDGIDVFHQYGFIIPKDEYQARYKLYLKSDKWKNKREKVLERANNKCEACLEVKSTEVHHTCYKNIFNEPLFDLRAICGDCHGDLHQKH